MDFWSAIVLVTLVEYSSGIGGIKRFMPRSKFHKAAIEQTGVAVAWSPEETVHVELLKRWEEIWTQEQVLDTLRISCHRFTVGVDRRKRAIYGFRVEVESKLEGFKMEEYTVTGCPSYLRSPLMQSTTFVKQEHGYTYETLFRDENDACYRRTYVTVHHEFTVKLTRADTQPIKCTAEVVSKLGFIPDWMRLNLQEEDPETISEIDKVELKIKSWSISGEFDKSRSTPRFTHYKLVERLLHNRCLEASVTCIQSKKFITEEDILVADIAVNTRIAFMRLDRVLVLSCDDEGLAASFMCEKQECINDDNECEVNIIFQMPEGVCHQRLYTTKFEYEDKEMTKIKWLTVKRDVVNPADCPAIMKYKGHAFRGKKSVRNFFRGAKKRLWGSRKQKQLVEESNKNGNDDSAW